MLQVRNICILIVRKWRGNKEKIERERERERERGERKREGLLCLLFLITCTVYMYLYMKRAWETTCKASKNVGVTPSNYPFPISRTIA